MLRCIAQPATVPSCCTAGSLCTETLQGYCFLGNLRSDVRWLLLQLPQGNLQTQHCCCPLTAETHSSYYTYRAPSQAIDHHHAHTQHRICQHKALPDKLLPRQPEHDLA